MKKSISEIVGTADGVGKSGVTMYRALRLLLCARCGDEIKEGTLFTRRTLPGYGLRILPQCQECAPFSLQTDGGRERRTLLDSLLTPWRENGRTAKRRERDAVAEAVERRLSPALRRCARRAKS